MLVIWGFSDASMGPKTKISYLWRHQDTTNNAMKSNIFLRTVILGSLIILEIEHFEQVGNDGRRNILTIRLIMF